MLGSDSAMEEAASTSMLLKVAHTASELFGVEASRLANPRAERSRNGLADGRKRAVIQPLLPR